MYLFFCLYCAAVRYEKPTRHPSKASAKKYLKVGKQVTARPRRKRCGYQNEGASAERERDMHIPYIYIDMSLCVFI